MGKSPVLGQDADGVWIGGAFWDGRATGWTDGKPLIEQAKGPFLNPGEMNNASEWQVVRDVKRSSYAWLFKAVYGWDAFADVDKAYHNIADAIAAFERSSLVNTYSSRYDTYDRGATWALTKQEKTGLALFNGKAGCNQCHPSTGSAAGKALFTDFSYDNLGLPANPDFTEPPLGFDAVPDVGLGGFLRSAAGGQTEEVAALSDGAFKVPTLRNVGKTAPYGHNGVFMTLKEIVRFYNTRDVAGGGIGSARGPVQREPRPNSGTWTSRPRRRQRSSPSCRTLDDRVEFRPLPAH